jgi:2-oxoglutarate dehydrogenase E1 component
VEAGTTVQITMPQMGDSVTEGTVLEWHKQVGEQVEADETLLEVSTDKVDAEVPAPVGGTLVRILVEADETVPVGTVLGEIDTDGGAQAPATSSSDAEQADGDHRGDESGADMSDPAATEMAQVAAKNQAENGAGTETATGELVDVVLPQMGESVQEGTVLDWHRQVGEEIAEGDTLVEISTDKVDAEIPSPVSGVVAEILAEPDETVSSGTIVARIRPGAAAGAADAKPAPAADPATAPRPAANGDVNATPVAARIADAHGLDLAGVEGSGARGRVTKDDVLALVEGNGEPSTTAPAPAPDLPPAGAKPIRGPAATLARFMNESRTIPTATSFRTVPVGALDANRKELKAAGRKLSFTHLIAWAIVQAARGMHVMTNAYAEADGKPQRIVPEGVSLGLAVDVERKDGTRSLIVPVIHQADRLDFAAFAARYDELVVGARDNTLSPDAYAGANITLTNPGGIGTVASVPRLMPGQGTIVATGAIALPPGLAQADPEKLAELGVGKVMTMTSTYDHRVIQGAESGEFLKRIDALLQGEEEFYATVFGSLDLEAPARAQPLTSSLAPVTSADPVPADVRPDVAGAPGEVLLQAVQAATSVVKAYRMHGHLAARLDPLGTPPRGDPALDPATVNLTPELMREIPASVLRVAVSGETFADALPHLEETYCGTIAYEIEHIAGHNRRVWLRQTIEWGAHRTALEEDQRRALLQRLSEVEALESYLHKAFLGKKQFSIEGLDVLVPMLDELIEEASGEGAREMVLGMAHRGRLNVLAHTIGRPYEAIIAEFEAEQSTDVDTAQPEGGTGDVKYHYGAAGTYRTKAGKGVTVTMSPNPSHLEFINPIVEGRARADQTSRKARDPVHDPSSVLPVLLHGDAAFPGQGVVAETLNLQALSGYSTGGTIHVIMNNQLGFTTDPNDARSTRYASDLAKGYDVPVIHVNADDVEACIHSIRLAMGFRREFRRDVVIDLIGYRRFGHNETDEPGYTQPLMYDKIKQHPPVRKIYAQKLIAEGLVTEAEADAMAADAYQQLADAHAELRAAMNQGPDTGEFEIDTSPSKEPRTAVPAETLRSLNEQLLRVPAGFSVHRKLKPQLERRRDTIGDEGGIDWAQAEALAFASLLVQGIPIRLTGQDSERGTFSQRHLALHDTKTGEKYAPVQNLKNATAPFELHNSPLSEIACLGFEYGYSVQAPETLVLWEAQFGDFVNAAQVVIDQFLVSGLAKWGQTSRLTLLLPHGYEGSGPEHSSGRVERFLQLAAEGNIRVANVTTPAQYFHLLRRQALVQKARPLVVMTPKSLLRLPAATSHVDEIANGGLKVIIDDPAPPGPREEITKLVLCTGKVYYDIVAHEARQEASHVAVARVELLYPFAENELRSLIESYPNLKRVTWVQEEPRNMGARAFMRRRLAPILPPGMEYTYVGREFRASPGEGYAAAHRAEQRRIVEVALDVIRGQTIVQP